jgi:hypothetical protein
MNEPDDFSDVLADDITVDEMSSVEFEFDNFTLRRESHHWEVQFESAEGEEAIVVEREDFIEGKFEFGIDGQGDGVLTLEEFDRIEKFAYEQGLIE